VGTFGKSSEGTSGTIRCCRAQCWSASNPHALRHVNVFLCYGTSLTMSCRSQWSRCLRHELSSLAETLGSWVRILLEPWISGCVYSVFVLGSGLATGWSLVQGVLPNVLD
jgi:hypothetical protein